MPVWFLSQLFWFVPLRLLLLIPVADWMAARRERRVVALVLLGVSVFSASFSPLNPWVHPWIYQWLAKFE